MIKKSGVSVDNIDVRLKFYGYGVKVDPVLTSVMTRTIGKPAIDRLMSDVFGADAANFETSSTGVARSGPVSNTLKNKSIRRVLLPMEDGFVSISAASGSLTAVVIEQSHGWTVDVYASEKQCQGVTIKRMLIPAEIVRVEVPVEIKTPAYETTEMKHQRVFAEIAAIGIAVGLYDLHEWYLNWYLHAPQLEAYGNLSARLAEVASAFAAVVTSASANPEDTAMQVTWQMWHEECVKRFK